MDRQARDWEQRLLDKEAAMLKRLGIKDPTDGGQVAALRPEQTRRGGAGAKPEQQEPMQEWPPDDEF